MEIPTSPDDLTAEWLTKVLRETGAIKHAYVTGLDIAPLDKAKARFGFLVRLRLKYSDEKECGPESLIVKFSHTDPVMRAWLKSLYEREIRFYETIASKIKLRTPRYYYGAIDLEGGEHILLLEDLASVPSGDLASGCSVEAAKIAIDGVAQLHAAFWESPQLEAMDWLPQMNQVQFQQTQEDYQRNWDPFLEKVGHILPDRLVETGERFRENVVSLHNHFFDEPPQTLIHGDYHIDNLLVGAEADDECSKSFAVVDWQTIGHGRGVLDVRSFLCHGMSPADRLASEMDILDSYFSVLVKNGVCGYSFGECLYDYRYSMLDSLCTVVQYIGEDTFKDEGTKHLVNSIILPRISAAILDLNVGDLLPK